MAILPCDFPYESEERYYEVEEDQQQHEDALDDLQSKLYDEWQADERSMSSIAAAYQKARR